MMDNDDMMRKIELTACFHKKLNGKKKLLQVMHFVGFSSPQSKDWSLQQQIR